MNDKAFSPQSCARLDLLPRSAGETEPSGADAPGRRAFSAPPEIGATVAFRRSPSHELECGTVWGRVFGNGAIEIIDERAKPLRLEAGQYELVQPMPTPPPGRSLSPAAPPPVAGESHSNARTCPPCSGDCRQGRDCPARVVRSLPDGWWIIPGAAIGAFLWFELMTRIFG